jgi:polar amino acid transport system substrate-binding protein
VHRRFPSLLSCTLVACTALLTACGLPLERTAAVAGEVAPPAGLAQQGFLTVAVPADLPPYGFRGRSGSQGLDVDLGQAMAVRMGLKLSVVALDPQDLSAAARGGGVDVVLGSLAIARNAPPPPDLTLVSYLRGQSVFVVRQDSAFQPRQLEDVCGRNIALVAGTPQQALFDEAVSICGNGAPNAVAVRGDSDALQALKEGRAAVYLADTATASYDESRDSSLLTSSGKLDEEELALGMRTGGALLTDAITRDFYLVRSDGTYELLLQKWGMTAQTV